MPKAQIDSTIGHQMKYDHLAANVGKAELGALFVGGGDPVWVGYQEMEIMRAYTRLSGASIVDIGCGIGRLARNLAVQDIHSYLGLDVVPSILEEAVAVIGSDDRFKFELSVECKIPLPVATVNTVVGFSVITHLIDEEIYEYICESKRVLISGGVAIFSFFDFLKLNHRQTFFKHAAVFRQGHGDMLRFITKDVLAILAKEAGFRQVHFVDGGTDLWNSRTPTPLFDVASTPETFQFEQSLCVMRM